MCVESEKAQAQTQADARVQATPEQVFGVVTSARVEQARSAFVKRLVHLGAPKGLAMNLAMAIATYEADVMEAAFDTDFNKVGELLAAHKHEDVAQGRMVELEAKLRELSHAALQEAGPDATPETVAAKVREGLAKEFGPELAEKFGVKVIQMEGAEA